jgi:hypothetical protein
MELRKSKNRRRSGVILTYLFLAGLVLIFEYCQNSLWTSLSITVEIVLFLGLIASFIFFYVRTELWSFIHRPMEKLDEREIALTGKSLRYAYGIFTVVILSLLLSLALLDATIDVVMVAALILFAHLLPASVIAWTEKEV